MYTFTDLSEDDYRALSAIREHAELVGGFERLQVSTHNVPLAAFDGRACNVLSLDDGGRRWLHSSHSAAGISFTMHSVDLPRDTAARNGE